MPRSSCLVVWCMIPEASSGLRLAAASRVQSSRRLLLCPGSFWSFVLLALMSGPAKKQIHTFSFFFFFRTPAICQFGWSSQIWNSVKQCETCIRSFVECIIQCCQSAVEGYDMMLIRSTATMNNYLGQKIKIVRTACSCAFYLNMQCSCWAEWCHETSTGHGKCAMASVPNIHRGAGWIHRLLRLLS